MDYDRFLHFVNADPSVQYVRLQWLDYCSTLRLRILPIQHAINMVKNDKPLGITKAALGLTPLDTPAPSISPIGEYILHPCFESLKLGERSGHATVQCELRTKADAKDEGEVPTCPRAMLRKVLEEADTIGVAITVGFEVEIVFMSQEIVDGEIRYGTTPVSQGHAWSTVRAVENDKIMTILEQCHQSLKRSGIEVQMFHPEACPGQYEFALPPEPPLAAIDTLIAARGIISSVASRHSLRATLTPKPFPDRPGTGAHTHISIDPPRGYEMFYAGILRHLPAITAFTYPSEASYDRVADGCWAGGTWVAWGTQNREAPLRKINDSH